MSAMNIILGVLLILFSISVIIVILLQEGNQKNVGVVTGGADTFLSKNKARSANAFLVRWTRVIAVGFVVLVMIMNAMAFFTK